jgi:ligand-binding sensor domain-containing protein
MRYEAGKEAISRGVRRCMMRQRKRERILCIILCGILAISAPAMAEMVIFAAGPDQISSVGVLAITQNLQGDLFFGTDNGLSLYNGAWHILHRTYGTTSKGLLSDHVLALGFDSKGYLWIGYPNGLQRLEGDTYVTIADQQMLKSLDIHDILRRDREMWIAAGNTGIHRYLDGTWSWFSPSGREGLGCTYVTSMATDPARGTLYVACNEGIWFTNGTGGSVAFSPLVRPGLIPDPVRGVHGDPFGGIYIYNASAVLHFAPPDQWGIPVTSDHLTPGIEINDLGVGPDRTLWIATNNGIYAWRDGQVRDHLDTTTGIRNNAVKRIFIDSAQRLWFVTPENVGYSRIAETPETGSPFIPITTFELPTTSSTLAPTPETRITPAVSFSQIQETPVATPVSPLSGILDALLGFFGHLFSR